MSTKTNQHKRKEEPGRKAKETFLKESLDRMLSGIIKQGFDGKPKVSIYDTEKGATYSFEGDSPGWAASIIKFPIMVAAMREASRGRLKLEEKLAVNHAFTLEAEDTISMIPNGELVSMPELICEMIVNSDNEATNMIANRIGIETINTFMQDIGMDKSMMGHLLCPGVPRYTSKHNKDGSNITTPNDMVISIRQVYDERFSKLDENTRTLSDYFFTFTEHNGTKSKTGFITDAYDGTDSHEVGIINDRLIYAIMINKIGQKESRKRINQSLKRKAAKRQYSSGEEGFNDYDFDDDMIGFSSLSDWPLLKNALLPTGISDIKSEILDPEEIIIPIRNALHTGRQGMEGYYIRRPYTNKNLFPGGPGKDIMNEILAQKRKTSRQNYSPPGNELHDMIKNILKTYLYL